MPILFTSRFHQVFENYHNFDLCNGIGGIIFKQNIDNLLRNCFIGIKKQISQNKKQTMEKESQTILSPLYGEETLRGEWAAYHLRWALLCLGGIFIPILMWFRPDYYTGLVIDFMIIILLAGYNLWLRNQLNKEKLLPYIKYISVTLDICAINIINLLSSIYAASLAVTSAASVFVLPILLLFAALRHDRKLIAYATFLTIFCFNLVYYIYYPYMDKTLLSQVVVVDPIGHTFKSILLLFFGLSLFTFYRTVIRLLNKQKELFDSKLKSEEQYRLLAENSSDVIWTLDIKKLRFTYISPSVESMRGYAPQEAIQLSLEESMTPETLKPAIDLLSEELRRDKEGTADPERNRTLEFEQYCKDGSTSWAEVKMKFLRDKNGKPVAILGASRDISDRKRVENQMLHSEKMAALGSMVAGVAHEISTPLGVGLLSASYLMDNTKEYTDNIASGEVKRSEFEKYTKDAVEASSLIFTNLTRAADLLNSFKQVAVDQVDDNQRIFDLKDNIDKILISLHPEYKRTRHTITVNCPEDLKIKSYPGAFSQIITNLVMNSLIHGFGGIEQGIITIDVTTEDDTLIFSYIDNGVGMDNDSLKRIFDPFFTTKRNQGGTGLGMHIVYSLVVKTLKGDIGCTSQKGNGISFLIKIPLS